MSSNPSPDYAALPAREPTSLNAALATALGIHKGFVCPRCGGRTFGTVNPTADPADTIIRCHDERGLRCDRRWTWDEIPWPAFDTDWAALGGLVEAMTRREYRLSLNQRVGGDWVVAFFGNGELFGQAAANTLPRAVCLAALAALAPASPATGKERAE